MGVVDFVAQVRRPYHADQIATEFELAASTLWITMNKNPDGCQSFTLTLLFGLRELLQTLQEAKAPWRHNGVARPVHYAVMKSGHPDYFSLGGDLKHFRAC